MLWIQNFPGALASSVRLCRRPQGPIHRSLCGEQGDGPTGHLQRRTWTAESRRVAVFYYPHPLLHAKGAKLQVPLLLHLSIDAVDISTRPSSLSICPVV